MKKWIEEFKGKSKIHEHLKCELIKALFSYLKRKVIF